MSSIYFALGCCVAALLWPLSGLLIFFFFECSSQRPQVEILAWSLQLIRSSGGVTFWLYGHVDMATYSGFRWRNTGSWMTLLWVYEGLEQREYWFCINAHINGEYSTHKNVLVLSWNFGKCIKFVNTKYWVWFSYSTYVSVLQFIFFSIDF